LSWEHSSRFSKNNILVALDFLKSGLQDGIFSYQKYQFWYILEGLVMEITLVYFMTSWYFVAITWKFIAIWIFGSFWYIFPFWFVLIQVKNLATLLEIA
jgi:hypothetical protein